MSFNFFDWVRDGVKNSVLLGVSDAVNTMGMPHEDFTKEKILGFLKNNPDNDSAARRITGGTSTSTKKLGRSLNDIAMKDVS